MAQLSKGTTYATGNQVTATNLNALVDNAVILPGAISEQVSASGLVGSDTILVNQSGLLRKATVQQVVNVAPIADYLKRDGSNSMTADLPLANSTPSSALSAASKGYVDSLINSINAIPSGMIAPFAMSTVPSGWLECNGQSCLSYPTLTALGLSNVPDLRGEFVRGWDNGRGIDANRAIRSNQADEFKSHSHTLPGTIQSYGNPSTSGVLTQISSSSSGATGGTETRPRNVALMYCIKI